MLPLSGVFHNKIMRKSIISGLDEDSDKETEYEHEENENKDENKEIEFSAMKEYVPKKVRDFIELQRKFRLHKQDVQKSKEEVENLMKKIIENEVLVTDIEMNQLLVDTKLQYEIIRLHMHFYYRVQLL